MANLAYPQSLNCITSITRIHREVDREDVENRIQTGSCCYQGPCKGHQQVVLEHMKQCWIVGKDMPE